MVSKLRDLYSDRFCLRICGFLVVTVLDLGLC